jgi:hypothetical protein
MAYISSVKFTKDLVSIIKLTNSTANSAPVVIETSTLIPQSSINPCALLQ